MSHSEPRGRPSSEPRPTSRASRKSPPADRGATITAVQVGSTIGQYRLLRKVGEGGMGVVFVGEHVLIQRRAAIKLLKPEISKHRRSLERFFNEARATAAIQDPGIAQLFDVGLTHDKSAYIVMELLDGESLDVRLQRVRRLAPADALRIVRQVAGTLAAVHAAGIIHRDLKPANLFSVVDAAAPGGERIKILDFGVAKLGPDLHDGAQTRAGALMGTPVYMSPEQCSGAAIDPRADIYSLGCVLFRLVTGRPPFAVKGVGPVIAAHLSELPPPPSRFVSELPAGFDDLVLRCLAKSREDRFPTMAELGEGCDRLLVAPGQIGGASIPQLPDATTALLDQSTTLGTLGTAIGEQPSWRRRKWIGAVAIGVIAGIVVAVAVTRDGGARTAAPTLPLVPARAEISPPPGDAAAASPVAADATSVAPPPRAALPQPAAPPPPAVPPSPATEPAVDEPAAAKPPVATPGATKPHPKPRATAPHSDPYEDRN